MHQETAHLTFPILRENKKKFGSFSFNLHFQMAPVRHKTCLKQMYLLISKQGF